MQTRTLGTSGLLVSRYALGTMTWGRGTDEHDAKDQFAAFRESGGTLIDTADVYGEGASETILGGLLSGVARDSYVLATKAVSVHGRPRRFDASRAHLLSALEGSLRRLGVDHVDLWQLHAWDPLTPIEETLTVLEHVVATGRARYVGISNYAAWQMVLAAQGISSPARIVSTQMEYSLLERGIEREVVPAAQHLGIGILPWSPLGRGVLTGKYRHGVPAESRASSPVFGPFVSAMMEDRHRRVVDAVATAAEGLGVSAAEVSLAWLRDRPGVVAPIVGARTVGQLRTALASDALVVPTEIATALDDVSFPAMGYPEYGWSQRGRTD